MVDLEEIRTAEAKYHLFADLDADAVQAELSAPTVAGPLSGRLVGLKANVACREAVWSAGLGHRAALRADADAHVTRQLRAAGARVLPGLNMDAAALGGTTENPHFGATLNPRALECSAGGSSGGSAAAIAAGIVDISIGTDTLGSIRIPASWCGVYGLKPTFGAIGRSGIVPLAESFDCVGPLTARAEDLLVALQAMAGPDPQDQDANTAADGWLECADVANINGVRIGVKTDDPVDCAPEVAAALNRAVNILRLAGATIVPVSMPGWHPAALRKAAFLLTECEGAAVYAEELADADVLPPMVQSLLSYGRDSGTAKLVAALTEIRAAKAQLARTFSEVDVLITPTTPGRAIRLGDVAPANQADYTALANVAGTPALAVPVSVPNDPLPASVQLMGPAWSEGMLINLAQALGKT
ncbi:MAG: amidase [Sulfitobacter sp.]